MPIRCQDGVDLGARMHAALTASLQGAGRAVLIGSDCPEYDPDYLRAAFTALDQHDAVIGPAADGGYVLIGLRRPPPGRLFEGIAWGGPEVYAATCERLGGLGMRWRALPPRRDLDDPAGLTDFPHLAALGRGSSPGPETGADGPVKG
jgi:rSAM/selenodomain-associated transferase 1